MTTELRELMTSAADDSPPHDLAGRAVAGARRRRQGRLAVAGSIAAVTALVAGAIVFGPTQRASDEPRPQDVASLPRELPGLDGLPELTSGAMDAASVAYVINDRLVLVDADTADTVVWNGSVEQDGFDTGGHKVVGLPPQQVRLSPDGTKALVAMRFEWAEQYPGNLRYAGMRLAVLDLASAEARIVLAGGETTPPNLQLSDEYAESGWLEYNVMAWSPDGKTAYCVCTDGTGLGIWSFDVVGDFSAVQISPLDPSQISIGAVGLMVQLEPMGGPWSLLTGGTDVVQRAPAADVLTVSLTDPSASAWTRGGRYTITSDSSMYPQVVSGPLPAGPVSSMHSIGADDFVLISRPEDAPAGEPAPPSQLLAHRLAKGVDPELLTTFPAGTTSTSFAAEVGANR